MKKHDVDSYRRHVFFHLRTAQMNQSDETCPLSNSEVIGLWRLAEIVTQVSDSELITNFANVCLAFFKLQNQVRQYKAMIGYQFLTLILDFSNTKYTQ